MVQSVKKSDLQAKLESQGWEWLTNESTLVSITERGMFYSLSIKTDDQIKTQYSIELFSDVLLAEAYDVFGNHFKGARAVYVKRK